MSGINFYPSREQPILQKIIETGSNISLTYSDIGNMYYCYNQGSTLSVSVSDEESIPRGAQFNFIRMFDDVDFPQPNGFSYYSSVGAEPKLRSANSACTLIKLAPYEWAVVGDIVAS